MKITIHYSRALEHVDARALSEAIDAHFKKRRYEEIGVDEGQVFQKDGCQDIQIQYFNTDPKG